MPGINKLVFSFAAFAAMLCSLAPAALYAAGPDSRSQQKISIVFSYPPGQWSEGIVSGLSGRLARSGMRFELRQAVYDSPYYSQRAEAEIKAEVARLLKVVGDYKPDFIVLCDDEGADALAPEMKKLGIPLLFAGINKEEKDVLWLEKGAELTGVFERYPVEASLKLLANLTKGRVKNISLLTSVNPTSVIIEKQLTGYFKAHKTRIALKKVYMTNKWDEWKGFIQAANKESDSLWMLVPWNVEDAAEHRLDLRVMGKWMSENIRIPSISIVDVNLQLGAMASISMTPQIMGEELGDIIHLSVTEHRPLSSIPYRYPSKHEIIINKKQADRLGVKIPIGMLEYAKVIKEEGLESDQ